MDDSTITNSVLLKFQDLDSDFSLILEDDGRVAYGYLLEGKTIVSDVWLYNVSPAPELPEWPDRSKMPFLNPNGYPRTDIELPRIGSGARITCDWIADGVEVKSGDEIIARLFKGARPAWSKMAMKSGPLAKRLEA